MCRFLAAVAAIVVATSPIARADQRDVARSATVVVMNTKGNLRALGAGVIIDSTRSSLLVVTAAHTLDFGGTLTVATVDGQVLGVTAVTRSKTQDLAVLRTAVPFGLFQPAKTGSIDDTAGPLRVIGHVGGTLFVNSEAKLQSLHARIPGDTSPAIFAIDCATCGVGDSGGGVFDSSGTLLGIVTSGYSDDSGRVVMTVAERIDLAALEVARR